MAAKTGLKKCVAKSQKLGKEEFSSVAGTDSLKFYNAFSLQNLVSYGIKFGDLGIKTWMGFLKAQNIYL